MSKRIHTEAMDYLCDGLLHLKTREEAYQFLEDLCTVNELEELQQRFAVAALLQKDCTYQNIAKETGASTATISRVSRALNYGNDGYQLVLDRMSNK